MKTVVFALFLAASALAQDTKIEQRIEEIGLQAYSKRIAVEAKADRDYRAAIATTFQFADRAEVYLLDSSIGEDAAYQPKEGDRVFPIHPYERKTKILQTIAVPAKALPVWLAAVTKMVTSEKGGTSALCHYPIHAIRLYADTTLLFETSICWNCGNYYFDYRNGYHWVSLTDDSDDLSKLLHEVMPIPKAQEKNFPK